MKFDYIQALSIAAVTAMSAYFDSTITFLAAPYWNEFTNIIDDL